MQDVEPWIVVNTRIPLAAKEVSLGDITRFTEAVGGFYDGIQVVAAS